MPFWPAVFRQAHDGCLNQGGRAVVPITLLTIAVIYTSGRNLRRPWGESHGVIYFQPMPAHRVVAHAGNVFQNVPECVARRYPVGCRAFWLPCLGQCGGLSRILFTMCWPGDF